MEIVQIMSFSNVPQASKTQINKAGKLLAKDDFLVEGFGEAAELLGQWRACHAYPINTFQATLRLKLDKLKVGDYIVAQRLKRLPTIIDKLKREPSMQITTMQDIGGVRAILENVESVNRVADEYLNNKKLLHVLKSQKNYISFPRDADGYRSRHLIYRYKNKANSQYDDLMIEIQLRTKLQHAWATAVESMGTTLGQKLKSRQGEQKWIDFFAITSSAFAYKEGTAPVPRFAHMSQQETFQKVAKLESELSVLQKMQGISIAIDAIRQNKSKGTSYFLIILDSINKKVSLRSYDRDGVSTAIKDYNEIEIEVAKGAKIEPVLVSSGPLDQIKRAYPNFFLDTSSFINELKDVLLTATKGANGLSHE